MGVESGARSRRERFNELLLAGKQSYDAGDRRAAHDRWREAAAIDPYSEKVWTALLRVLDDEDDRRVCLENIIAINPMNVQARRLLYKQNPEATAAAPAKAAATETVTEPKRPVSAKKKKVGAQKTTAQPRTAAKRDTKPAPKAKRRRLSVGRLIALVIAALVVAVLLALVLSVVIFGRH